MFEASTIYLFIIAAATLVIIPGPAVLYIVARGINHGRVGGIVSVLGIESGAFFHVAAASLGLSAILTSSALAFSVVKYLGAAYLIYLGIRSFLAKDEFEVEDGEDTSGSLREIYTQGVIVNALNPKTALFFLAFLPQFVNTQRGDIPLQFLLLGLLFVLVATISDGLYALLSGTLGGWLKQNLQILRAQKYFAGSVYIALGLVTAFSGTDRK
ncbi:MAG: LysE family translocator [Chloroflexi bacterium]|nr:MAG: LysE family translocator [Chloroflexota bacterium]MBL1193416.1 LysE family translocator [Chloroflexota bacterium]NOH10708.1 LysE family translocator [Chloroflexota bacterium]